MATKKQHQAVYAASMKAAEDYTEIYKNPNERFSYRAHLIEDATK